MRAFDSANVTTGCPFRPWASRLGALSASALLSLFSSGLAFPAQPAPASASMLSPHADDTHPGPLASSGQSQSVAPGQTPKGISAEAWARMMAQVQSQTYEARPDPRHRDTLIADNPAQRLAVRFERNQVSFTTGTHATLGKHDRIIRLRSRLGEAPAQPVAPVTAGNRVEYPHAGYTEWYVNDAMGFEQGWTLGKPQGGGKTPYIRIEVTGARTVADGENAVRIEDRSGTLRYRYAGLKAWDADHRVLASTLRLARSGRIDIAVDDRGARYPITVDPTLTATQEIVLGAGGADSLTSVAVDGDTIVVGVDGGPDGGSGQAFIFSRNTGGADAWGLAATLNDPAQTDGDSFASAVAVNGDTVVVAGICAGFACAYIYERDQGGAGAWGLTTSNNFGAPELPLSVAVYGDTLVEHYGTSEVVYVSSRNARGPEAWGGTAVLTDPQGSSTDGFGYAVAINGDTLVVGASGTNNNQGQAYVYSLVADTNNWQLSASLSDPAATAGDGFGVSIAVNGDTLVVGATGSSGYQGKAYVFGRNQGLAGSWSLAKTLADPAATDQDDFGIAVAVNGDFVVVGADGVNNYQGKVYVFERNQGGAGSWGLAVTLSDPAATSIDQFGYTVSVNGDTLIVGLAGFENAYVYDLSGGSFSADAAISDPSATAHDDFGVAVAVNGDTVVVGASGVNSSQGKAYVFERNQGGAGSWGLAVTLSDPAATANDYFGYTVSVDGDTAVVGAYGTKSSAGAVYIYGRNKNGLGAWGLVQSLGGAAGSALGYAVSVNGATLAIDANGPSTSGGQVVQIWQRNGSGIWQLFANLADPLASNDDFGAALAVYGDTVIVGAQGSHNYQGAVYIYNRNQGRAQGEADQWRNVATINDPAATNGDDFGSSVAVNGATAVVGAPGYGNAQGRAYIYGSQVGGWGLIGTLQDPAATAFDDFGAAVAVSGDTVVVGSPLGSPQNIYSAGAAYVFNRNQGGASAWGLILTQTDPNAAANDSYGNAVAVDGETVAIGAYQVNQTKGEASILSIQQATAAKDARILWRNTNGQVVLWNMNGAAIASAPNLGTVPAGWSIVGTADFNGDGSPDVLWRNTNGDVVVWFTNGTTVTSSLNLGIIPNTWSVAGAGDFNGNGNADILWRNSNGDTVIWFMNGSGIVSSTDLGTVPASWSIAGTGDFNDDGDSDILWRNSNGDVVIWFMDGGTLGSSANLGVIATSWNVDGTGDFNGDGHSDILWRNSNGDVVIWFMNGGTVSSSADLGVVPSAWTIAGTGDFNGNGKYDILWRNTNGDTVIWFMNGGAIASSSDLGVVATSWSIAGVSGN